MWAEPVKQQRTVRFSEQPTVSKQQHSSANTLDRPSSSGHNCLPERHNDALFSPYDVFTAASLGNYAFVEEHLKSGFYPDRLNSSGWSALMYAAYLGHGAVCSLLLAHNASVDTANSSGQTALMLAAACGNLQIVQLLASKGAKVDRQDSKGNTALHYATLCSHNHAVELLLQYGASPNIKNNSGMTATLIACSTGHETTLVSILQHGGDPNVMNNDQEDGRTIANDSKVLSILNDPPHPKKSSHSTAAAADVRSLDVLFKYLNLESKYCTLFNEKGIDLEKFLKLTENEISDIGVKAFGPKKKMMNAIERYRIDGNFQFLLQSAETTGIHPEGHHNKSSPDKQLLEEFTKIQKELVVKDNELRKMKKALKKQREIMNTIKNSSEETRKIALKLLQDVKGESILVSEEDIRLIELKQREILAEILEVPSE